MRVGGVNLKFDVVMCKHKKRHTQFEMNITTELYTIILLYHHRLHVGDDCIALVLQPGVGVVDQLFEAFVTILGRTWNYILHTCNCIQSESQGSLIKLHSGSTMHHFSHYIAG